jgi:hypothetical protein
LKSRKASKEIILIPTDLNKVGPAKGQKMKRFAKQSSVLLLLFVATIAYSFQSSIEEYHMLGVNLNLKDQKVNGDAKRLKFDNIDEVNAVVTGQVANENVELSINDNPYVLDGLGGFLKDMKTADVIEFDFENGQKNLRVEASSIIAVSNDRMSLSGVKGNCHINSNSNASFEKFVINTCTTNATLNMAEFKQNKASFIEKVLQMKSKGGTRLSNLNLQISNHNLRAKVKVHAQLTVTAKIEGHVEYLGDKNTLALRIDKARASFLNIKKKIFEEVEQMNDPNITVERPYIYFKLEE